MFSCLSKPLVFSNIHATRMLCNFLAKTVLSKPTHKFYFYLFMWTLCKDGKRSCYKLGFMKKKTSMFNNSFLLTWKTSNNANHTWSCGRSMFFLSYCTPVFIAFSCYLSAWMYECYFMSLLTFYWGRLNCFNRSRNVCCFLLNLSWRFHETAEFAKFNGKIIEIRNVAAKFHELHA